MSSKSHKIIAIAGVYTFIVYSTMQDANFKIWTSKSNGNVLGLLQSSYIETAIKGPISISRYGGASQTTNIENRMPVSHQL